MVGIMERAGIGASQFKLFTGPSPPNNTPKHCLSLFSLSLTLFLLLYSIALPTLPQSFLQLSMFPLLPCCPIMIRCPSTLQWLCFFPRNKRVALNVHPIRPSLPTEALRPWLQIDTRLLFHPLNFFKIYIFRLYNYRMDLHCTGNCIE